MRRLLFAITILAGGTAVSLLSTSCNSRNNTLPDWALGEFVRPEGVNPVIRPDSSVTFICPMSGKPVGWKESDTFNPAATVYDGKIAVLYRAEDNSATGIGQRTSRIGLAFTSDGTTMEFMDTPVMYPDEDKVKEFEWPGGCEDPRVTVTPDGTYYMMYTTWNRKVPRLCVASSDDLIHWHKHGPAFADAYNGRFADMASKSGSVVTRIDSTGKQVIAKINGKYLMYWGEEMINLAESEDLIHWIPQIDSNGELKGIVYPREGYFDSQLTECGPPAVLTENGIVLMYNGKNRTDDKGDKQYPSGTYSAGQILFDASEPATVLDRLDTPFFVPSESFEKSGQYADGTVFIEGLTFYKEKWYLYYGCADSFVGVAIWNPAKQI
ncbi:MAG: glycoside hydrolase family 130 protein [Candidatus Cryptobacteroides sp.]